MTIIDLTPTFSKVEGRHLTFTHDNKILRDGILVKFSSKGFNLKFDIKNPKTDNVKAIELPYPFNITKDKNSLIFDYNISHIKDLVKKSDIEEFIEENQKIVSRFYNSTVTITLNKTNK